MRTKQPADSQEFTPQRLGRHGGAGGRLLRCEELDVRQRNVHLLDADILMPAHQTAQSAKRSWLSGPAGVWMWHAVVVDSIHPSARSTFGDAGTTPLTTMLRKASSVPVVSPRPLAHEYSIDLRQLSTHKSVRGDMQSEQGRISQHLDHGDGPGIIKEHHGFATCSCPSPSTRLRTHYCAG